MQAKKTYLNGESWSWEFDMPESSNRILVSYPMLSTNNPEKCDGYPDFVTLVDGAEFYWKDEGEEIFVFLPKLDGSIPTEADRATGVAIPKTTTGGGAAKITPPVSRPTCLSQHGFNK